MLKRLTIRLRILLLAGLLMLLASAIAAIGWYAISDISASLAESVRVAKQAQFVIVAIREFAGADRSLVSYVQAASDEDEQVYEKRKAASDAAFVGALDLVRDPGRRQAMLDGHQSVKDFMVTADTVMRDRKALRPHRAIGRSADFGVTADDEEHPSPLRHGRISPLNWPQRGPRSGHFILYFQRLGYARGNLRRS